MNPDERLAVDLPTFESGALYSDRHGDTWRAVTDGTEFLHVKRADEQTPDHSVNRWCEASGTVARDFGPMVRLTESGDPLPSARRPRPGDPL